MREIDLHRLTGAEAERRVAQELHAARVRGEEQILLITGRGFGNATQQPVLRRHMETWLKGTQALSLGVRAVEVVAKGGALRVALRPPGGRRE